MRSTCALLVIDMQRVAFDGKVTPAIAGGQQLLRSVSRLIGLCRDDRIHIVYVQTCAVAGQPYARDVHGWEIHPRVAPHEGDHVVYKRHSSGFDGTDLENVLSELGVRTLLVCGIWSEFCVANTSIDARKLGFEVFVAADAHGTVAVDYEAAKETVAQQNWRLSECGMTVLGSDALVTHLAKR